ncbi:MAG: Gfo/Idh/MocA family oxidoreductase [Acidimicrobiia bacterium]|nr:Gfo/Idh/MocA family oxidoreductase [Acidimicrobiia bacterium]
MRWGIVGTGRIAAAFAGTIAAMEGHEVVAVSSGDAGRASAFADAHGIRRSHAPHGALAEAGDVDAVYVATTNERHLADAVACVDAGLPVLCEKPLTLDAGTGRRLLEHARASGVFLMEAMWMRFLPAFEHAMGLVADGAGGEPTWVRADFGFAADLAPGSRLVEPRLGGGALLDIGIYPLTLVHHVLGVPDEFVATGTLGPAGADTQVDVVGRHGAATSSTSATFLADTPLEAVVAGPEGRVRLHRPFHGAERVTLERGGEVVEIVDLPLGGSGYRFEAEEVARCLDAGRVESPRRPHADTLAVLAWMDEIRHRIGVVFSDEGVPGPDGP